MKKILLFTVLLSALSLASCDDQKTYIVQFDTNGGSFVEIAKVNEGEKLSKPVDPTKENYIFDCWTLNGATYDFNSSVSSDFILKANWIENFPTEKCSFTFISDYCELNNEKYYELGEQMTLSLTSDESNNVPADLDIVIGEKIAEKGVDYTYEVTGEKTATLSLKATADVVVKALISGSDNAYRISTEQAFNSAIDMKDMDYVQREYEYYIHASVISIDNYLISSISPTINEFKNKSIDSSGSYVNVSESTTYFEKVEEDCFQYYKKDGSWTKENVDSSNFQDSSSLSPWYTLGLANITYDTIKDCFNTSKLCYEFIATNSKGDNYNVIMVFKDNKLMYFEFTLITPEDYYYGEFGYAAYTYLEYVPILPVID